MIKRIRTPESVRKRIDLMLKNGEVILDHGCGSYKFNHYEYEEPRFENNYESKLVIYYKDFDGIIKEYMTVTENNLRKPTKNDGLLDWFVDCYWEKKYPTLLYMREYQIEYI